MQSSELPINFSLLDRHRNVAVTICSRFCLCVDDNLYSDYTYVPKTFLSTVYCLLHFYCNTILHNYKFLNFACSKQLDDASYVEFRKFRTRRSTGQF